MNLFEPIHGQTARESAAPLAWRMRPQSLDEIVGQAHLLAPGRMLRRAIEADRLTSLILYGPPGTGKTALAGVIARKTRARFHGLNAVLSGVADIRRVLQEAQKARQTGQRTLLFIDEIHRFNRVQQDALLPAVEQGTVILMGASTQNPSFALIPALSSRSQIFELKPLENEDVRALLQRALNDPERGLGKLHITVTEEALDFLVTAADGDARRALNAVELAALTTQPGSDGTLLVDLPVAGESIQRKALGYDEGEHYDTISAYIKSMRGSDPDAALYWLGKMITAGEDPLFIARRLIIAASEDVGMADPRALSVAVAALHAVEAVGMPEGRIPLAEATVYLAAAPKSNAAYQGIERAMQDVAQGRTLAVPDSLRDASTVASRRMGRGQGYRYPHDYPQHHVAQTYLPEARDYYEPTGEGEERAIGKRLKKLRDGEIDK